MRTFLDKEKNEWDLTLTVGTVKRVSRLTEIDLLDLTDKGYLAAHHGDPMATGSIIWAIVLPQAEKRELSEDAFCDLLTFEVCKEASEILVESLTDFFPESKRPAVAKLLATKQKLTAKTAQMVVTNLEAIDVDVVAEKIAKEVGEQATP